MRKKNFEIMSRLGKNNRLRELGCFIQDLEDQLWDGHPYIYPNIRIFLEEFCDFIIENGINLKICFSKTGKSRLDVNKYYDELVAKRTVRKKLCGGRLVVKPGAWSFSLKVRTIEILFNEDGVKTENWGLLSVEKNDQMDLTDWLNERAHNFFPISSDRDIAYGQFEARFGVLRILHDGIYKDFLDKVMNIAVKPFTMPTKTDILGLVDHYYSEQKNKR